MTADMTAEGPFVIEVDAGNHARKACPVTFGLGCGLPEGKALRITDPDSADAVVPANVCDCCESCEPTAAFIVGDLAAGQTKRYVGEVVDAEDCCGAGVSVTEVPGERVDVGIGGDLFTSYVIDEGIARPYCYPVNGPGGICVTNSGPSDHVHHRSMYVAQGEVNGEDNWSEMEGHGRTINRSIQVLTQGPAVGAFLAVGDWVGKNGNQILEERTRIQTWAVPDCMRIVDWDITLDAKYGGVYFGDTKEAGTLSVRVAETMEAKYTGLITNAYGGVTESETWGKRAPWCDYSGEVEGAKLGLAIFDHPDNLRYPTYWHVRDYGLFTANQWGIHDFTNDWAKRGDYALEAGQALRFKFRVYIHEGDVCSAAVGDRYHDWATPPTVTISAE